MINKALIHNHIDELFGHDMHAKRVTSLANAAHGVIEKGSLAIHAIGAGLAQANKLKRKSAIKQVDRLLSNTKLNVWQLLDSWGPYIIGARKEIVVSLDWTEFDSDDHSTIVLSMQTTHGRNTPLLWKTHRKHALKGNRNNHEDELLVKLRSIVAEDVKVTIVADRGFSDTALFNFIEHELGFDFIIRIKANIKVTDAVGELFPVKDWLLPSGITRTLKDVQITGNKQAVARVICTKKKGMKEAWYLASSRRDLVSSKMLTLYGKRWGIETTFRDIKDYRFGMGMSATYTRSPVRRDRLFLLSALAIGLLTLLGKAGEDADLEKTIKANTSKTRSYSLFRQGCIYYELLPTMREEWAEPLMDNFYRYLKNQPIYRSIFGII
ncbi:transposase family protein [Shewanella psychrophila]|uniref:Transposase family protein n=2 Tax=Shewanella psychrophila TaxID=225848 RepID=A0A1S6HQG5_9GAMM|nr:IS4 family transposase [Shewanella psychrophila]AQS36045.1 transposase family protein [Shewanella psychrophila]AQS36091.1 transposase family protein [Shewanella psychrophila]AQS36617.1 transposase family protein [Shewanella psychrophila]AQS36887.1 transposase family protein [Shewanella psychrophila]AQS37213.1 transposase family protein [Shewanella psychrophila]